MYIYISTYIYTYNTYLQYIFSFQYLHHKCTSDGRFIDPRAEMRAEMDPELVTPPPNHKSKSLQHQPQKPQQQPISSSPTSLTKQQQSSTPQKPQQLQHVQQQLTSSPHKQQAQPHSHRYCEFPTLCELCWVYIANWNLLFF